MYDDLCFFLECMLCCSNFHDDSHEENEENEDRQLLQKENTRKLS